MAQLVVSGVGLRFRGLVALGDISFEVAPSSIHALIGPNGAGKTSMLNCLCGYYRPHTGQILFEGRSLKGCRPHEIAALGISRTFQNIELFEHMTVLENIMLGHHLHVRYGLLSALAYFGPAYREEVRTRQRAEEIIDFLELDGIRHARIKNLPYGLQKKVELGRAMAAEPRLLLLDEPMAGMNLEEKEEMVRFILECRRELGMTIILVEHDMRVVMDISDRVTVFASGSVVADGTPGEVRNNPQAIEAYLGGVQDIPAWGGEVGT